MQPSGDCQTQGSVNSGIELAHTKTGDNERRAKEQADEKDVRNSRVAEVQRGILLWMAAGLQEVTYRFLGLVVEYGILIGF